MCVLCVVCVCAYVLCVDACVVCCTCVFVVCLCCVFAVCVAHMHWDTSLSDMGQG